MNQSNLEKLKNLKIKRTSGYIFKNSAEMLSWSDQVKPLLKFDPEFYENFQYHQQFIQITTLSSDTLMNHLNPMISIVNDAIEKLESKCSSEEKFVVDTCIINKLVDGSLSIDKLPVGKYVATHIQVDEINKTSDTERRARLFLKFLSIGPEIVPTESAVIGISRIDNAKVGDGLLYNTLLNELDSMNNKRKNNANDVLIAEVAIKNNWKLLTTDKDLALVASNNNCKVKYWKL